METLGKEKLLAEILNTIFPSNEDGDTIAHIDMGYKEFVEKLKELAF
jgi:predicted RNA-binding protein